VPPNIILITTDQQRYDALGVNGNAMIRTPAMDALARDGVNFSHACVQNTVCVPSRACIQTGRYPHQHGVTYMETVVDDTPGLPPWELTFMEHLQKHGYCTGAVGKIHMYPEKGFDYHNLTGGKGVRWKQAFGSPLGPAPLGPNYAAWLEAKRPGGYELIYSARRDQDAYRKIGLFDNPLNRDEYVEHWTAQQADAFITRSAQGEQPFFLWYGFCGPHDPWDPPEPYRSLYNPADVPLPCDIPGAPSWRDRWQDESLVRRTIAYYWGMITCIDDYVAQTVALLKARGLYDNTLIILTSDHGEFLCERARTGKCLFYEPILRVPLILKPPTGQGNAGRVDAALAEVFGIAPTVLDYAGVPIPDTMAATSLRPRVDGSNTTAPSAVFAEYVSNDRKQRGKCVRTPTHKYIVWSPGHRDELYDLHADPLESRNLSADPACVAVKAELTGYLVDWLASTEWRHG